MRTWMLIAAASLAGISAAAEDPAAGELLHALSLMGGIPGTAAEVRPFEITAMAQDYGRPTANRCCHTQTPLRIGSRTFERGIGAHANGRITLRLNEPFARFAAFIGIDNNSDTQGSRGSARFSVSVDGQERFASDVFRGGGEPASVDEDLRGGRVIDLVLSDAGDGIFHDQADWAEARLLREDGSAVQISDALTVPLFTRIPASFAYGGKSCWELFEHWTREASAPAEKPGSTTYASAWTEPDTGFRAQLTATVFAAPPAMELQWTFENRGAAPSALITDVNSIDFRGASRPKLTELHSCSGGLTGGFDSASERLGFELNTTKLGEKTLAVDGGRSSNGDLPFYYLTQLADGWNLGLALGWSGQWRAEGRCDDKTGEAVFRAGLEPAHFRLPAGERAALPTALILPFQGGVPEGVQRLRRLLREQYQARLNGAPVLPPVSFNSWFVFDNRVNAEMLTQLAEEAAPLGIEYFCLDAGWFDGDFPEGVGNWTINRQKFPGGLKPLADHVHGLGMKFGLWFEPERVANGTRWQKEHPEWLLNRNLLDLGRPEARQLALDMLDATIREVGVDWIRYDFNIDPLPGWASVEGEDEQGLAQIRYINGVYALWEELMRRHPGLLIEQCSSGGRRIDLRTIRYGHTYWKSDDTYNQPLMRFHECGANHFLLGGHLNTNYCRYRGLGEMLALFGGPLGFGCDFRALSPEQKGDLAQAVAAYKEVRHLLNRDFHALLPQAKGDGAWSAWEFLDPETGEGLLVAYRPAGCPYNSAQLSLQALNAATQYELSEMISGEHRAISGADLGNGFAVALEEDAAQVWHLLPASPKP